MTKSLFGRSARLPSREQLYSAALMLAIFCFLVDSSTVPYLIGETFSDAALKALRYASYALVIASLFLQPAYPRRTLILIALVVALAVVNARVAGKALLLSLLYVIGAVGLDYRRIARAQFCIMLTLFCLIVFGSLLGVIENWGFDLTSARPRYCLGFFYPSHTTSLFFYLVLLFCFLKGPELRFWHVLVIAAADLWQYSYTDSRAGTVLALLAAIVMFLLRRRPLRGVSAHTLALSFLICAAVCLALTWLHRRGAVDLSLLNRLLAGRLDYQRDIFSMHHVGLFGQGMEWVGHGGTGHTQLAAGARYNYVDCSYIKLLFDEGILLTAVVLAGFTAAGIRAARAGDTALLLALAFSAVYCAVEQWLVNPGYHPFFVLISALFLAPDGALKPVRFRRSGGGAAP